MLYTLDQKLLTFRAWDTLSCLVHAFLAFMGDDGRSDVTDGIAFAVSCHFLLHPLSSFLCVIFLTFDYECHREVFFLVIYLGVLNASCIWMSWCLNENCSPQARVFGTLGPQLVPPGNL